jgi:hypothetical protein
LVVVVDVHVAAGPGAASGEAVGGEDEVVVGYAGAGEGEVFELGVVGWFVVAAGVAGAEGDVVAFFVSLWVYFGLVACLSPGTCNV